MASGSRKVVIAALIGNSLIAITKFIAAAVTRSSAMFSEGIHSVVDTGNQVLLLFGLHRANRPPDVAHPFGYGKEVYFWSFVVAILLFAVGAGLSLYEGVHGILHPEPIRSPHVNYIVLGIAIVFEAGAWFVAWREFNKTRGDRTYFRAVREGKDPTLFVVLFEDSAAMLGLLFALAGVGLSQYTGQYWFDGAASVGIGLILAVTAGWLAWESKGLLIGEGARPVTVEGIRRLVADTDGVERVNEVLTLYMGPQYMLVNVSATFAAGVRAGEMEQAIEEATRRIREQFPRVRRVFVEAERRR